MKALIKATLELFVEKANELQEEDFTHFLAEYGQQLSYQYTADSQQLTMSVLCHEGLPDCHKDVQAAKVWLNLIAEDWNIIV